MVISTQLMPADKSRDTMRQVAEYIDRWLEANRQFNWNAVVRTKKFLSTRCCCFCSWGKSFGTYLTGLYLVTKFLFVLNSACVFLIMHHVVGDWYIIFGYKLLPGLAGGATTDPYEGDLVPDLPFFPKVTFCDFDIWQMGNIKI
ncbi:innexin unc-7, partial [Aplysia californica]|uniref:Innexin unc-7 n=1 Tax=Aplysia californica TaxID=6500 RepID=A0ABM1AF07_APLCA